MEKRFVTFVVLSMLVLITFQVIDNRLNPPPQEDPNAAPAEQLAEGAGDVDVDQQMAGDAASANAVEAMNAEVQSTTPIPELSQHEDVAPPPAGAIAESPPRWATLGSLDADGPDSMLVWLNSRGASIECIALNNPRYGDIERRYGYLGFLSLEGVADGCRINVVGAGTPAANATSGTIRGLAAGDVLFSANDQPIASRDDFQQWITTTRPGDEVQIGVRRGGEELTFVAKLRTQPLQVIRPESDQTETVGKDHPLSYRLGLSQLGNKKLEIDEVDLPGLRSLRERHWELHQDTNDRSTVAFSCRLTSAELQSFGVQGPLTIIKRYQLRRPPTADGDSKTRWYHLNYEVEFVNEGEQQPITLAYQQDGPTGLPTEGWWYTYKTHPTKMGGAGVRDVVTQAFAGKYKMFTNPTLVKRLDKHPSNPAYPMFEHESGPKIQFAGVDAQYFASAILADVRPPDIDENEPTPFSATGLTPDDYRFQDADAVPIDPKNPVKQSRTDVTFRLGSFPLTIDPGASHKQQFLIFAGPKRAKLLAKYGLGEMITYGWFPLVAKPLMWILHFFNDIVHNYGIAIILLTVLVRSCMLPIGRQQALNAQKMQELAPEMRQIAEKYKNDMEKRAAAQRELFQKNNYNPLAGCLPMFLQLPIFIGLYRALSIDIELRQAPLIPGIRWCSNLAGPDMLWHWESFMPEFLAGRAGWLGPYFNVLPIITVGLMLVHQKLFTPPPTDESQEMQHKIMKYMMLFFALMFFRVPAGLCLYFITSNLWSVAERKLLPKRTETSTAKTSESPNPRVTTTKQSSNGSSNKSNKKRAKSKRR